jgi:hypothetical protein
MSIFSDPCVNYRKQGTFSVREGERKNGNEIMSHRIEEQGCSIVYCIDFMTLFDPSSFLEREQVNSIGSEKARIQFFVYSAAYSSSRVHTVNSKDVVLSVLWMRIGGGVVSACLHSS